MNKKLVFLIKLLSVIFLAFLINGCWNRREIDELAIISGIGIDSDLESNQFELTFQVIKPGEMKSSGNGSGQNGAEEKQQPYINYRAKGRTTFEIIRKLANQTSHKLYFAHNQVIIISEEAAQKGVREYLAFFLRDHEPRTNVWIIISREKASKILEVSGKLNKLPAMEINDILKNEKSASQAVTIQLDEFTSRLLSKTTQPIASYLKVVKEQGEERLELNGTAVFVGDRMVGRMDRKESRGYLWITDKIKTGAITVVIPWSKELVAFELVKSNYQIKSDISHHKIKFIVTIKPLFIMTEQSETSDLATPPNLLKLERLLNRTVANDLKTAFNKAKRLNADFFGFGEIIHREHPDKWRLLEPKWEEIFPKTDLEIKVNSKIRNTGKIIKPI